EADGAAAAEAKPLTPEEEALRRNTDCVYFLASPLTCKKGNQCDFRHSEGARMNPRDCYYWLNGNCLNPKCSFRHPVILIFLYFPSLFTIRPLVISASNWHQ
uniref:C3H1-type domain-containing protein n=1 Tax=Aegilops tauschii subsp. strangulata TaxID=200361 RepID=A0A453DDH2_AEGTS